MLCRIGSNAQKKSKGKGKGVQLYSVNKYSNFGSCANVFNKCTIGKILVLLKIHGCFLSNSALPGPSVSPAIPLKQACQQKVVKNYANMIICNM